MSAAGLSGLVIGLTGPMCAGKNSAARFFERRGFAVVDADEIAHQALADVEAQVLNAFSAEAASRGISLLGPDGRLNRRALGSLLFPNPRLLALHEGIVYPRINELLGRFIDEHAERGVVVNAPLLHRSPILDRCAFVVFVDAPFPLRLFRAWRRDRLPIRQILARFSSQKALFSQYISKNVDIVRVRNRGSLRALENQLAQTLSQRGY